MYIPVLELCLASTMMCQLVINESHKNLKTCETFMTKTVSNKSLLRYLASKHIDAILSDKFTYSSYCVESEKLEKFMRSKGYKIELIDV